MPLPLLAIAMGLQAASTAAGMVGQANASRAQQRQLDKNAAFSKAEFDKRMGDVNASDARIRELLDKQYADFSGNEQAAFDFALGQSDQGFNEQLGVAGKAFDEQIAALGGLMTAKRAATLKMQQASEAERARQMEFQGQADALAADFPGKIGFAAQEADRAASIASRGAMIQANTSTDAAPAYAKDARSAAYGMNEAARARTEGVGDSMAAAKLAGYRDAFTGSERKLGDFAQSISDLTQKAQLSRAPLSKELAVGKTMMGNAQEDYDWTSKFSSDQADKTASMLGTRRAQLTDAGNNYYSNMGNAQDRFYNGSLDNENSFIDRIMGTSTNYENKITNLNNFKMANTTYDSTFADLLGMGADLVGMAGKASAQKKALGSKTKTKTK